jgi:hypothetical protein
MKTIDDIPCDDASSLVIGIERPKPRKPMTQDTADSGLPAPSSIYSSHPHLHLFSPINDIESNAMSSPPSQPARPAQQPPLFISYVTGSRPSGQWTRVSREVIDLEPSISSEAGAAISFRRIEGTGGSSDDRRAVGSGETRREGRVSGNTRLGDSVLARNAAPAAPVPQPTTIAKMPNFPRSVKESTLRNLWNDATSSTPNSRKQSPEQLLKGIIVDYLTHERFPGTVGTLLGLKSSAGEGNGKGKARDGEGDAEEDVQMMESSSGLSIGSDRKTDAERLIRQIEWRKGTPLHPSPVHNKTNTPPFDAQKSAK